MERDAKYVIVGLFITAVTVGVFAFLVWLLGTDSGAGGSRYIIRFSNVAGLSEGGAVRYRGVDVGRVLDISINPGDPSQIDVLVSLSGDLSLNANTTATLGYQGITGIAYVDLRGGSGAGPPLATRSGSQYPVIDGEMSGLDKFLEALPDWADRIALLIENSNELLSGENARLLRRSLDAVAELTETLANQRAKFEAIITDTGVLLDTATAGVDDVRAIIRDLGPKADETLASIRDTSVSLEQIATRIDDLLERNDARLDKLLDDGSHELVGLAEEARRAADEIAKLARRLQEDPSLLLYQTPEGGVRIPE
jgi:phospholipid/cholesterol/gamma-HCH transport system substrate-binding protein